MLKYLLIALAIFSLSLSANEKPIMDEQASTEAVMSFDECDIVYDKCSLACDEKDSENINCYSQCELLYAECQEKRELSK